MSLKFLRFMCLVFAFMSAQLAMAETEFWNDLHTLVIKCAVRPYDMDAGRKTSGKLTSVCDDLTVSGDTAYFVLNGQQYKASIRDSENSDGGDFNDIEITSLDGTLREVRICVLSFGDVLLALAGGEDNFQETQRLN